MLASIALAGCANLPDPDYAGKAHKEDVKQLSRPEKLADVLSRVARNAERSKDYETAQMFYTRSHNLDKSKVEPLLGLGRSLAAMNEPRAASEAFGAALALNENSKEAETGLAKSIDLLAMKSGRTPPSDIPPPPAMAAVDTKSPAMQDGDAQDGDSMMAKDNPESAAEEQPANEVEVTDADFGGDSSKSDVRFVANDTGANDKASRVKLDDVLAAIEWKDNQGQAPSSAMTDEGAQVVASARPGAAGSSTPSMSDTGSTAGMPSALTTASYRLQLAAFSSQSSAQSARVRVFDTADEVLEDVSLVIEKSVGSGGKSVYKLRTGPVGDRARASGLCAQLKQRSIDCFLVVPPRAKASATKAKVKRPMMARSVPSTQPAKTRRPKPAMNMARPAPANPKPVTGGKPQEKPLIRWEVVNSTEEGQPEKDDDDNQQSAAKDDDNDDDQDPAEQQPEQKEIDPANEQEKIEDENNNDN